jgi:hypothetical protein
MIAAPDPSNGLRLANKFLGSAYVVYAATILIFVIGWFASVVIRASRMHTSIDPSSLVPIVGFLIVCILLITLNVAIGVRLLTNDRTRFTWVLVIVSLLEIPIGTGLGFLTLLWLFSLRDRR